MTGRAVLTAIGPSGVRRYRIRLLRGHRQPNARAATDRFVPKRSATRLSAQRRRRPDAEIAFGGEVSLRPSLKSSRRDASFRLGASRLDDRPPFGDLGFLVGAERLRGLALARRNDKALVNKVLTHGGIVRCANGGGVELVDDVPRRALGGEQTRPERELEPGEPRFLRRRDFGRDCDAVLGGDRKRLDPARAYVRHGGGGVGD